MKMKYQLAFYGLSLAMFSTIIMSEINSNSKTESFRNEVNAVLAKDPVYLELTKQIEDYELAGINMNLPSKVIGGTRARTNYERLRDKKSAIESAAYWKVHSRKC